MEYFITRGTVVSVADFGKEPPLSWILKQSHRIMEIKAFRHSDSNRGKIVFMLKDGSQFHATFLSTRSMIAWLFHPQFDSKTLHLYGIKKQDSCSSEFDCSMLTSSKEHWDLLAELLAS